MQLVSEDALSVANVNILQEIAELVFNKMKISIMEDKVT